MSMKRLCSIFMLFVLFVNSIPLHIVKAGWGNLINSNLQIESLLEELTPEEKIGQLFLIAFQGTDVSEESQIYDLITKYHIGGIILNDTNDNFGTLNLVQNTQNMITTMQMHEWNQAQLGNSTVENQTQDPGHYIPLFIGISQEGNSYPYDTIFNEVSQLPNLMAIGATWDVNYAENAGELMGRELSAMGFNLYFGPSLDVLDLPYVEGGDDLGTRTFGGDPYWVGELGKAYINGLHLGSSNEMAVIAKHFPGRGSSDRLPEEEVATVRKSLEQLKQIELAPFFSVTGNAPDDSSTIDGLLMSHIRYQGFQGNIRATTRPVSFDQSAQEQLMSLNEFSQWRDEGGVIISDNLASPAVRKFFDPTGESYDARQIARNAFLSGNDLLYFDMYVDAHDLDPYSTLLRVLEAFSLKYREDTAFAQKVDASVERILKLKLKMYPDFSIDSVIPQTQAIEIVGQETELMSGIANDSAVLMSPDIQELSVILPDPPQLNESIIFFTDEQSANQCSTCLEQSVFPTNALEKAILKLYGPGAGEQVNASRLASYSFEDLNAYLNDPEVNPNLGSSLRNANWIVFSFLKPDDENPDSMAMLRVLSDRTDLITNKKVIAFGFDAPYYLDATDISKLTAYYVLFSKTDAFIETAARILFQEQAAIGALPVSVPGIGYTLIEATAPDPDQIIPVFFDMPFTAETRVSETPVTPEIPEFQLGETISVRTGMIYDQNRNRVPDGTVVRFVFSNEGATTTTMQIETTTYQGIARVSYRIQSTGIIDIRATSDPANNSQTLRINVPDIEGAEATIVVLQTEMPTPTETPVPPTPTPTPTLTLEITPEDYITKPEMTDWFLMVLIVGISAAGIFFGFRRQVSLRWAIRWALLALNFGVLTFFLISMQILVQANWVIGFQSADILAATFAGVLLGWLLGWFWYASNQWTAK